MKYSLNSSRLIFIMFVLIQWSCSKPGLDPVTGDEGEISSKPDPCSGNYWLMGDNFYSHAKGFTNVPPSLVYNNKIYVFDAVEDEIRFYNGTSWDSIQSLNDVPYFNENTHVGFTIGNKCYLGYTSPFGEYMEKRFYEYDFAANSWTRVADFAGPSRLGATVCTFVVGNKAYVMGGSGPSGVLKDLWEYDPAANTWTQKADLPFFVFGKAYGTGFSIGQKGYVINGQIQSGTGVPSAAEQAISREVWEYNPATDTWVKKASFPGAARVNTAVFVNGSLAYAGAGAATSNFSSTTFLKDFYRFNPVSNTWTKLADINVSDPVKFGFSINSRGYFVCKTAPILSPDYMIRYIPKQCITTTPQ